MKYYKCRWTEKVCFKNTNLRTQFWK